LNITLISFYIISKFQRIQKTNFIFSKASKEIGKLSNRELFLIGAILYWAEGSKEKFDSPGSSFQFGNMDLRMMKVIIAWLERVCKIKKSMLVYELYIHKSHKNRANNIAKYWEKEIGLKKGSITRIYFKTNNSASTNRKNVGQDYYGLLRIRVNKSSTLVRQIAGWTEGIYKEICE
jgi:hypothetical protein